MRYCLDTNILLFYLRQQPIAEYIDEKYSPFHDSNEAIISAATLGEIKAIAKMNDWGTAKIDKIEQYCENMLIIDINSEDVLERYAEIDAFSQGKLKSKKSNFSSRNMGKNDLWIAATASVLGATLLTTDQDFQHLHQEFLEVICIKI